MATPSSVAATAPASVAATTTSEAPPPSSAPPPPSAPAKAKGKAPQIDESTLLLGRPGNNVKVGIVGLPNVGKSTFFNLLCSMNIPAENYPFCTLDPNLSRVAVPDVRWDQLCELYQPARRVNAFLTVTDIAGLVRGAHEGQGLGNAFLSHIRAVDAIYHVIRAFDDEDVIHVEGDVDPVRDLEIIADELLMKDIDVVTKKKEELERTTARNPTATREKKLELEALTRIFEHVCTQRKQVRFGEWRAYDVELLNELQLLTAKPVIVLVNLSENDYVQKRNRHLARIFNWMQEHGREPLIPFSCAFERKIFDMSPQERAAYCEQVKVPSAFPKIITQGYHALNLIHFFTCGEDEVKSWTIRRFTKAPQAAGTIHSDFEKGFICAEVMKCQDVLELRNEGAVKAAGKLRQEGKNYVVQDGDIILFKFNVAAGGKK
eukprot:gnl/Spiro4/6763_TR3495_c0_g1_i1.p1 gnl/Spiro4/6763_TR3495_c0_g1~~gnl/Spiro4/6763_TR3495_c0_g1_i1.p1  ORF type:complete len:446 (+),score=128.82 gnl/Spiro4/6763_TR3495_c0_g1_i1:42-1340(+)